MIDPLSSQSLGVSPATGGSTSRESKTGSAGTGGFSAALEAARKADSDRQAHANEMEAIKSKGFSAWVRDTQIENLKEKLRKQVMADMGLTEDDLSKLSSVMQEILRKKIEEEVEKRVAEETAKAQDGKDGLGKDGKSVTKVANAEQQQQGGKNDQNGKSCPVIPALSWPGGPSLF